MPAKTMKIAILAALASLAAAAPTLAQMDDGAGATGGEGERHVQIVSELNEKYCVEAPGPGDGTRLVMQYCDADSDPASTMIFRFTTEGELRPQMFRLTDQDLCVDGTPTTFIDFVRLQRCNGSAGQRWTYSEQDRQVRNGLNLCVDPIVVEWDPELYPGRLLLAAGCHNPVTSPRWALADMA